jgi:cell division initiation protein
LASKSSSDVSITPVEVRHAQLGRSLFGYNRQATDSLLESIAQSYEQTWWERADLRDEVERLQAELARFRDMEKLLRDTLVSAEKAADDLRTQARREYDLLIQEARLKSRELILESEAERERMRGETRRLQLARSELRAGYRAFLQAALERLDAELEEPMLEIDTGPLPTAALQRPTITNGQPDVEQTAAPGSRDSASDAA